MNRRHSLKLLAATTLGTTLPRVFAQDPAARDKFGGHTAKKFKPTGFFRTEKDNDERWWLVTPEGNAFLSFGINHLYPDLFHQKFNREAWQQILLGYSMTDCPLFTEEDCRERTDVIGGARRKSRIGFPRRLRNLGTDAPGKQAYVETVKEVYRGRIENFNQVYQTSFKNFDALTSAENWRLHTDLGNPGETRDNTEFLHRVVAKY